ncbi:MAG: PAS domain-containing protein [Candidatus Magnetominusculus sp. LBB02]|nr:PAS domain-containing protein [Candidatus Magnetominusculus sp. LBB02]
MTPEPVNAKTVANDSPVVSATAVDMFRKTSWIASVFVFAVGVLVIIGWLGSIHSLTKPFFSPVSMKVNTAIAFVLMGLSLWSLRGLTIQTLLISKALALVVALIGLLTLLEYHLNLNLGIDEALIADIPNAPMTSHPGRMSPLTAIDFVLLGIAIFVIDVEIRSKFRPSQFLAIAAGVIASMTIIGYVYGVESMLRLSQYLTAIALHTSIAFIIAAAGVIFARPDKGLMLFFVKDSPGSIMARRLFAAFAFAPLLIDAVLVAGRAAGYYDISKMFAINEILLTIIIASVFLHTARYINRLDDKRRLADNSYRVSEANVSALMNAITESVALIDLDCTLITVNDTFAMRFNKRKQEIIGKNLRDILAPVLFETRYKAIEEVIISKEHVSAEDIRAGITFVTNYYPVFDAENKVRAVVIYARDITLRKNYENYLLASLREKEALMREIHHRVKNNLQIISGLINLQLNNITDKTYAEMFTETKNRIRSIALVHNKLYQSKGLSDVDLKQYITSLTNELFHTFGINKDTIALTLDVEDVTIGIDSAVPIGLIINELFTNALKYAFPNKTAGKITISTHKKDGGEIELIISDNGIGLPEAINFKDTQSLGLHLVNILVGQIRGTIELDRTLGTKFVIRFLAD